MAQNRGKQFEEVIRQAFLKVPDVSVDRLHDQVTFYKGSTNICDFIVYKKPYEYYIECKSVHGNVLPFSNISITQWEGLLEKSTIKGVTAGIICWWIDRDITGFIPIQELQRCADDGRKSIRFDDGLYSYIEFYPIAGKKKRVFFEYDMDLFFRAIEKERRHI